MTSTGRQRTPRHHNKRGNPGVTALAAKRSCFPINRLLIPRSAKPALGYSERGLDVARCNPNQHSDHRGMHGACAAKCAVSTRTPV
jgi:hypothetical protein